MNDLGQKRFSNFEVNEWIRILVFIGVGLAIVLLAFGRFFASVDSLLAFAWPLTILGIALLLITPIARLIATALILLRLGDYRYSLFTLVIVLLLAAGLLIVRAG